MVRVHRALASLAVCAALLAAAGCSPGESSTLPPAPSPDDSPEASLVEQRCSMCHPTQRVYDQDYDAQTWDETIERMKRNGLVITDEEKKSIIEFLVNRAQ